MEETVTFWLTVLAAIGLIGMAMALSWRKEKSGGVATAVLGFGFLMLVLLHMSKFKHVNGFGFEAETWDEKQVEAAKLVDQLSSMTEALSSQIVLLSSRVGLFDSALTNPELMDVYQKTKSQLEASSIPVSRRNEILEPLRQRIISDYWWTTKDLIQRAYLEKENSSLKKGDSVQEKIEEDENINIQGIAHNAIISFGNIDSAIAGVRSSKILSEPTELIKKLEELNDDIKYFFAHGELRRVIDLQKTYQ